MTLRLSPLPPRSGEELRSLRVHEVVRDYPELRSTLHSLGVDVGEAGGQVLGDLFSPDAPGLQRLLEELGWRVDPEVPAAYGLPEDLDGEGRVG
ncbi:MAG: hypothetical protein ACWGSQ_10215 [Longimicrobiales bacterium]